MNVLCLLIYGSEQTWTNDEQFLLTNINNDSYIL